MVTPIPEPDQKSQGTAKPQRPTNTKMKLESQELVGNDKEFRIATNYINLKIVGNNNRLYIRKNKGQVQVIGNGVKVKIIRNYMDVEYVGNHGRVYMGRSSPNTKLRYTGVAGSMKLVSESVFDNSNFPEVNARRKSPECPTPPIPDVVPLASEDETKTYSLYYSEKGDEVYDHDHTMGQKKQHEQPQHRHHHHHHHHGGRTERCDSPQPVETVVRRVGKLNISLPELNMVFDTTNQERRIKNLKISCSTECMNINSFYHIA